MRKLNTKDAINFMRLLKKSGTRKIVVDLLDNAKNKQDESVERIGIDAVFALLEGITTPEAEVELYKFLSGPFEKTPEEVEAMEFEELFAGFRTLAKENNLEHFFTSAFDTTIIG